MLPHHTPYLPSVFGGGIPKQIYRIAPPGPTEAQITGMGTAKTVIELSVEQVFDHFVATDELAP